MSILSAVSILLVKIHIESVKIVLYKRKEPEYFAKEHYLRRR